MKGKGWMEMRGKDDGEQRGLHSRTGIDVHVYALLHWSQIFCITTSLTSYQ